MPRIVPLKAPQPSKKERAALEAAVREQIETKGLVKTSKKLKLTPVSLRSFVQGGVMYGKTLARIARFAGMPALAKTLEAGAVSATPAPKKAKPAKKAPKKAVKTKAPKKAARAAKPAPKKVSKKRVSSKKKKKKKAARDRTPREPVSVLAGVPVGKELDRIEEEDPDVLADLQHQDELEVAE